MIFIYVYTCIYTHTCGHDWPTALAHRVDSSPHHAARLRSSDPADESSQSPARCWLHQPEPKDPGAQVYLYVGVSENGVPSCTLLFSPFPCACRHLYTCISNENCLSNELPLLVSNEMLICVFEWIKQLQSREAWISTSDNATLLLGLRCVWNALSLIGQNAEPCFAALFSLIWGKTCDKTCIQTDKILKWGTKITTITGKMVLYPWV